MLNEPMFLNQLDVLAIPAVYDDPKGLVLLEAMACGVPVVGSDSAEIPRVIGGTGRVVPENNADCLLVALRELAASPHQRALLGSRGRERVLADFTHERISARTVDFLFDLVNS